MIDAWRAQVIGQAGRGKGRRGRFDEDRFAWRGHVARHGLVAGLIGMKRRRRIGVGMADMDDRQAGCAEPGGQAGDFGVGVAIDAVAPGVEARLHVGLHVDDDQSRGHGASGLLACLGCEALKHPTTTSHSLP